MAFSHSFFVAEPHYVVCTHHIFIRFPADGHLGCSHVLAFVNSAAVNIEVHVSFQIRVFSTPLISAYNQVTMDQLLSLLWGFSAAPSPPNMALEFREAVSSPKIGVRTGDILTSESLRSVHIVATRWQLHPS